MERKRPRGPLTPKPPDPSQAGPPSPNPRDPETSQPPGREVDIRVTEESPGANIMYKTRKTYFGGQDTYMVCQNQNGPCALLSIFNVLLLKGLVAMEPKDLNKEGEISEAQLMGSLLSLLRKYYQRLSVSRDFELETLSETVQKLAKEFAVNVNFASTHSFGDLTKFCGGETEVAVFTALFASLYHGWLIDPQDMEMLKFVGVKPFDELEYELQKYNSFVESGLKIGGVTVHKWTRISELLNGGSLSHHGLLCLREDVQEGEVCVLFWHKHFHTMVKYNGHLYLLQTDENYVSTDVVWKELAGINGEGDLLSCFFTPCGDIIAEDENGLGLTFIDFLLEPSASVARLLPSSIDMMYKAAGEMILSCTDAAKREDFLKRLKSQMNKDGINTFYESVYVMMSETNDTKGSQYLSSLMEVRNQELEKLAKEFQKCDLEKVIAILQMNREAAKTVGKKFSLQIQIIFPNMMLIYRKCTQQILEAILEEKPVEHLRCVNREVLNLLNTYFEAQDSLADLATPLIENPLFTYGNRGYETREHEFLSLFLTILNKCTRRMNDTVRNKLIEIFKDLSTSSIEIFKYPEHCLQFIYLLHATSKNHFQILSEGSCKRLNLVMNFIIGALVQTEKDIGFKALSLLHAILEEIKTTELKNGFYKKYFFEIGKNIIKVLLTGTKDTSYSEFYLYFLQQLCDGAVDLTEYIWKVPLEGAEYNTMIIRDTLMKSVNTTMPTITVSQAGAFVDGILNSANDLSSILNRLRESSSKQVDPGEASAQGVPELLTHKSTGSSGTSVGTTSREHLPFSEMSFASIIPFGTDTHLVNWFRDVFLATFTESEGSLALYRRKVRSMYEDGSKQLHINFDHLMDLDPEWAIKICNCFNRIKKRLSDAAADFIMSEAGEFPVMTDPQVLIDGVPAAHSVVLFEEHIKKPGNEIIQKREIFRGPNTRIVEETTLMGRKAYYSYSYQLTSCHERGRTWDGTLERKHFLVLNNTEFRIWKPYSSKASNRRTNHRDYKSYGKTVIPLFRTAALFGSLISSLEAFLSGKDYSQENEKIFRLFVRTHLAGKHPMVRSTFWSDLLRGIRALSKAAREVLSRILSSDLESDWTIPVKDNLILKEIYNYNPDEDKQAKEKAASVALKGATLKDMSPTLEHGDSVHDPPKQAIRDKRVQEITEGVRPKGDTHDPPKQAIRDKRVQEITEGVRPKGDTLDLRGVSTIKHYGDGIYHPPTLESLTDYLRNGNQHLGKPKHGIKRLIEIDLLLSQEIEAMVEIMWNLLFFSSQLTDEIRDMLRDVFYAYDLIEPDPNDPHLPRRSF